MLRGAAAVSSQLLAVGFWLFNRLATKDGGTFEDVEIFV
jgi:hypothetical protein